MKKRSLAQRLLGIISFVEMANGVASLLLFVLLSFGVGLMVAGGNEEIKRFSPSEIIFGAFMLLVNLVLIFIEARNLKAVSKDENRHEKALTSTMVLLAYEIFYFIISLGVGVPNNFSALLFSIFTNLIVVFLISRVRMQTGKM